MKKIFLGTDHAGFEMKEKVREFLTATGYQLEDCGCFGAKSCDYPDFIIPTAEKVATDLENHVGIVFGGSGQGEGMAANKVTGIRAAIINSDNLDLVELSRTHNNANMLSLGARFLDFETTKKIINVWLNTKFEGGRHERRVHKLALYENKK